MITVKEALGIIDKQQMNFGTEHIPLAQSIGRILRETIYADRDFPPYNRVTMDGICLQFDAFAKGIREFPIEAVAAAGAPQMRLSDGNKCMEVMTGSILPENTDVVIRYEDLEINNGLAKVMVDALKMRQNIHGKGEDRQAGNAVILPGKVISPAEIGVAATVGKAQVEVSKLPKVMIISTGDELVDIHESPKAHQIRRSNVYRLETTLQSYGIVASTAHLNDDLEEIKKALAEFIEDYDVLLLSGGVSKGKFDYLPEALAAVGVEKLFHKIKQRPGKPFWFGRHSNDTMVFALPGNPVSSFVCTHRYFMPWLKKSIAWTGENQEYASLAKDLLFKPDLTYFAQVKLHSAKDGKLMATPIEGHGSGDLANLVDVDAFIELPQGKNLFEAGEAYPLIRFR